jgi:hypothetical protein
MFSWEQKHVNWVGPNTFLRHYGLGQCLFMTEKTFEIRHVKYIKLYISSFALSSSSQKKALQ